MRRTDSLGRVLCAAVVCAAAVSASAVTIETTAVGYLYNDPDPQTGYGTVNHGYEIAVHEVTAGQYCEFLNAVADTDSYALYSVFMDTAWDAAGCNIVRDGSSGSYTYSVASEWADRPVNHVNWGDAARFCNWLHNGQPEGAQTAATTEDGAYALNGATSNAELLAVTRKEGWQWAIPAEDEWYKAAYHRNDGAASGYYLYPTAGDTAPSNQLIDPDPGSNATFDDDGYTIGSPYYRTAVGAHELSESPYGTFDQGGNVWEWNEAVVEDAYRGQRGGSFSHEGDRLAATDRSWNTPTSQYNHLGFRVVHIPEPSVGTVLLLAAAAGALRRRP
jgi:formylglycine-generating enzyme required for sulfatase activity